MAVCGSLLRSLIPRSRPPLATLRHLHSLKQGCGQGRALLTPSYSRVLAQKRGRKLGVCGSLIGPSQSSITTMPPIKVEGLQPAQVVEKCIAENKVMIFSKSFCPFCHKVRRFFVFFGVCLSGFV